MVDSPFFGSPIARDLEPALFVWLSSSVSFDFLGQGSGVLGDETLWRRLGLFNTKNACDKSTF